MYRFIISLMIFFLPFLPGETTVFAAERFILVQSTTSTQNSGLYDAILPQFTEKTGIEVRVVAVGTGQAIKNAERCDGDVLVAHAKAAEEAFVAAGYGVSRTDLMYNDFVLVGPAPDPAGIVSATDPAVALSRIAAASAPFVSRSDDSGTHKKEMELWKQVALDPTTASGSWYRETGSGMGATLNIAAAMKAYTLTDRATWTTFANKADLKILVQGSPALLNQYGIILVNPRHCSNVRLDYGQLFINWMLSDQGQEAIAAFRVKGEQLFFLNSR